MMKYLKYLFFLVLFIPSLAGATTYYVSTSGSGTTCSNASPCALSYAQGQAVAGDTVYLKTGTFDSGDGGSNGIIEPTNSGSSGSYITFMNAPGETPVVDGAGTKNGVHLEGKSYIKISGISISSNYPKRAILAWGDSECNPVHHIEIASNTITTSGYQGLYVSDGCQSVTPNSAHFHDIWIHDNEIYSTLTSIDHASSSTCQEPGDTSRIGAAYGTGDPNYNVTFEDNRLYHAGHGVTDWYYTIKSVVRNNFYSNEPHITGQNAENCSNKSNLYSNEGGFDYTAYTGKYSHRNMQLSDGYSSIADSKILFESNRMGHSGPNPNNDAAEGLELSAAKTIIRFNDFYDNMFLGLGIKFPTIVSGNTIYNNTFFHNGYGYDFGRGKYGLGFNGTNTNYFKNNLFYDNSWGDIGMYGGAGTVAGQGTWAGNWCDTAVCNYSGNPYFTDTTIAGPSATQPDLTLQSSSGARDKGVALTTATHSSAEAPCESSPCTTITVDNARYFQDGTWGADMAKASAGLGGNFQADCIAVGSATNIACISSIDYDTNIITLATAIAWADNASVYLYSDSSGTQVLYGALPDVGAHEIAGEDETPPVVTYLSPEGELDCTTDPRDVTVTAHTNEAATCRISTSDQTYAQMTSSKNMDSTGGTVHTHTLSELECETAFHYYIACADSAGNEMVGNEDLEFSIVETTSSDAPIFTYTEPSSGQVFNCTPSSPVTAGVKGTTNKAGTCKWGTSDAAYADLPNTYDAPTASNLTVSGRWLYYNGLPIWLVGMDLQQLFNDASYNEAAVEAILDELSTDGINTIRVWMNTWFLNNPGTDYYPYSYADGDFNLGTFSTDFFTRWKTLIAYAKTKGIIVEVVIFSEYPADQSTFWSGNENYWRAGDNDKTYYEEVGGDFWPEFFTLNYAEDSANLTTIQKALVAKAINEFNGIGNVFFLIANEFPTTGDGHTSDGAYVDQVYEWQQEMADYAKSLGAITFVHGHEYFGLQTEGVEYWNTRDSVDGMAFHPYTTKASADSADEINTLLEGQFDKGKVLLIDESWDMDAGNAEQVSAVVREMFSGFVNGVYTLAYWDDPFTVGDADYDTKKGIFTTLKNIAALVEWSAFTHNNYLIDQGPSSSWQCASKTGEYYVCYLSGTEGSTAVRFPTLPTGTYDYKYYITTAWNAAGIASGSISGGSNVTVTAPSTDDWVGANGMVLVVIKQGVSPPTATGNTSFYDTSTFACGAGYTVYTRCTDGTNTATSSVTRSFSVAPATPSSLYEAEDGTLVAPMVSVADAASSGGYYITTTGEAQGTATFTVDLTAVGATKTYRIVARVFAADTGSDSMFLQVDSLDQIVWDFDPAQTHYNTWWVDAVKSRGTGTPTAPQYDPYLVELTAAEHTFVFTGREIGARLDYFYLVEYEVNPVPPEIAAGGFLLGSSVNVTTFTLGSTTNVGTFKLE